jgi:hypothetical protein
MRAFRALLVLAGPAARRHLAEHGLTAADVRVIPAAAGGPKGLILQPLDRFLFGHWLQGPGPSVHLLGASIGAWRMASACMSDPDRALSYMAEAYVRQDYPHELGKAPVAATVSRIFQETLQSQWAGRTEEILQNPRFRLHVFTSRGRHILQREGRIRTPLGYGGAFLSNLASRRALGGWLQRVVFSGGSEALPLPLNDFSTRQVELTMTNLTPAVLASCSIPFWLSAVHDIPGAPRGAYWDGGITDYHLHLRYDRLTGNGWVLYPHFQSSLVPGWLDKLLRHRHHSTSALDRVIVLAPRPEWVANLPGGKLPDRSDFKEFANDLPARMARWRQAIAESQILADEFASLVATGLPIQAEPL